MALRPWAIIAAAMMRMSIGGRWHARRLMLLWLVTVFAGAQSQPAQWPSYGGDAGGMRYSAAAQITRENVKQLQQVWEFHTHALDAHRFGESDASFEATPIFSHGTLYLTSPFDVVFALDAKTGQQQWNFDPKTEPVAEGGMVTSRGVSLWEGPNVNGCARRIVLGTIDARLMEIDAETGKPCMGFGQSGTVDLSKDVYFSRRVSYGVTSAPAIAGNVIIVGSTVGDNQSVDAESGVVRAFDVVTGRELWSWEPLPWAKETHPRTGAGNAWSTISVDAALGLAYVPTGSAAPDYWGGTRPGDDRDADSIVALDIKTGKKVWAFQVVHHDLWDYDIAAQPLLFTFHDGTPAVAVATKMGQIFVFDRRDGRPLFPIEERPVPQSDVPGEMTSATQPFSALPPVGPMQLEQDGTPGEWQRSARDEAYCKALLSKQNYEGIYTPPSERGSILFPGNLGGVNWGSMAYDPTTGMLYANNNRAAYSARLVRRDSWYVIWHGGLEPLLLGWPVWIYSAIAILVLNVAYRVLRRKRQRTRYSPWIPGVQAIGLAMLVAAIAAPACFVPWGGANLAHFGHELSPQRGAPYWILRDPLTDRSGRPCVAPPWGALTALNLNAGTLEWQAPLGTMVAGQKTGTLNFGGPMVTAGGLVFTAAAADAYLRAFDAKTGEEVWTERLPAPAQSTPMTFVMDGKQYVVVSAGGHASRVTERGDSVVAFALPR